MTYHQESTLSGFDQFAPKAFLISLARFEEPLSPELIAEVNEVGEALASGELEKASALISIAQKDAVFYEDFKKAYKELQELDESEEKNKFLPELDENAPSRPTNDDYNNFLAPPLTHSNPQSMARRLLGKARDLVKRVYRLKF